MSWRLLQVWQNSRIWHPGSKDILQKPKHCMTWKGPKPKIPWKKKFDEIALKQGVLSFARCAVVFNHIPIISRVCSETSLDVIRCKQWNEWEIYISGSEVWAFFAPSQELLTIPFKQRICLQSSQTALRYSERNQDTTISKQVCKKATKSVNKIPRSSPTTWATSPTRIN